jgi:multidrug efflux system membrane fusion protein
MRARNVLIVVASAAVAACGHGPAEVEVAAPPVRARIVKVESARVPNIVELYGTVEAEHSAAVSSRVMATVTALHVKPGDRVQVGQLLVEIDPTTARGQEAQARGALAQAQAALALAERNLQRFTALAAEGAASALELDTARMQYEQAKGAVTAGEGAVEAAASVARESKVVAPFDGWVSAKLVEVGDLAAPGRPLVMVESVAGRRLVVAVPETLLVESGLKVGSSVPVRIDALTPGGPVSGTVTEIHPAADPASHSFTVKIAVAGAVPAGVSGRAGLPAGNRVVIAVPSDAVLASGGLDLVVVRDGQGRSRSRAVRVGAPIAGDRTEVLSGLAAGEDVAVGLSSVPPDGTRLEVGS